MLASVLTSKFCWYITQYSHSFIYLIPSTHISPMYISAVVGRKHAMYLWIVLVHADAYDVWCRPSNNQWLDPTTHIIVCTLWCDPSSPSQLCDSHYCLHFVVCPSLCPNQLWHHIIVCTLWCAPSSCPNQLWCDIIVCVLWGAPSSCPNQLWCDIIIHILWCAPSSCHNQLCDVTLLFASCGVPLHRVTTSCDVTLFASCGVPLHHVPTSCDVTLLYTSCGVPFHVTTSSVMWHYYLHLVVCPFMSHPALWCDIIICILWSAPSSCQNQLCDVTLLFASCGVLLHHVTTSSVIWLYYLCLVVWPFIMSQPALWCHCALDHVNKQRNWTVLLIFTWCQRLSKSQIYTE